MLKASDVKGLVLDKNKCQICNVGNLILHKSTFEQYQPSIYQCDKCENELSIPQMNKADAIISEISSKEFYLEMENLNKVIKNIMYRSNKNHEDVIESILQSFNAGHLLRVK